MAVKLSSVSAMNYGASIVTTSNGAIYIFHGTSSGLSIYKSTNGGTSFDTLTAVTNATMVGTGYTTMGVSAAVDANGYIHVAISANSDSAARDIAYSRLNTSNDTWDSWEEVAVYSATPLSADDARTSIAIDSSNKPHVLYVNWVASMGNDYCQIYYKNKTGASWSSAELVSQGGAVNYRCPVINVRGSDIVEATWGLTDFFYRTRTSGTWGSITTVTVSPSVTLGQKMLLSKTDGTVYRYYSEYHADGEYLIENGSRAGTIAADANLGPWNHYSMSMSSTTRYAFYRDYTNGYLKVAQNSGSGWNISTLASSIVGQVIAEWAYNCEYQVSQLFRMNCIFSLSDGFYYDYYSLGTNTSSSKSAFTKGSTAATPSSKSAYVNGVEVAQPAIWSAALIIYYVSSGTPASNSKPAFLKAQVNTNALKNAFTKGSTSSTSLIHGYMLGILATNSQKIAYVAGQVNDSSALNAFTKGATSIDESRSVYVSGKANVFSQASAFLSGKLSTNHQQDAFAQGCISVLSSKTVFLSGKNDILSSKSAFIYGEARVSSILTGYMEGQNDASDAKPVYTRGKLDADSLLSGFVRGNLSSLDTKPAYLHGSLNVSSSISAFINVEGAAPSSIHAYLRGYADGEDAIIAFLVGQSDAVDSINAYLIGQITSSLSVFLSGRITINSAITAYTTGFFQAISNKSAFTSGKNVFSSSIAAFLKGGITSSKPVYLAGGLGVSDNQPAFVRGSTETTSQTSVFLQGKLSTSDEIIAYLAGKLSTLAQKSAFTWGQILVNASKPAFLIGQITDTLNAYLAGGIIINDTSPAYTAGRFSGSSSKPSYLKGLSSTIGSKSAFTRGLTGGLDNQPAYLAGKDISSSLKHAFISGKNSGTSQVSAFLVGSIDISGNKPAYILGVEWQYTVPSSDVEQDGAWLNEDYGSILYASIDETDPNDADYAWHPNPAYGDYFKIGLGAAEFNVGEGPVTIEFRTQFLDNATLFFTVDLYEGGTLRATRSGENTGNFTTFAFQLTQEEKDSITNWDNLFAVIRIDEAP